MKGQTKLFSFMEQVLNVASGFIVALLLWRFLVTPYLGIEVDWGDNFLITSIFTAVSILRGYIWRRIGNKVMLKWGK